MAVQLDLRPDRNLLDPNFESYRLSLDSFPVLKKSFSSGVECVELGDDQFSFLHAHLLSLVNHLFYDYWAQECIYFVDEGRHFQWSRLSADGRLSDLRVVWQIPFDAGRQQKAANGTVSFAGQEWAVASDGSKMLYLINTPSRSEGEPWQLCYSFKLESAFSPCLLLHSLYHQFPSSHQVECLLSYICKQKDLPHEASSAVALSEKDDSFICVLEWITFSCLLGKENSEWQIKSHRRLGGSSVPVYACLEPGASCINLVSKTKYQFLSDSEFQGDEQEIKNGQQEDKVAVTPLYSYMQSLDDVVITFRAPQNLSKSSISIHMEVNSLLVKVDDKIILGGTLAGKIEVSASTWILEGNKLELTLTKWKTGELWKELVLGDPRGQEIHDPILIEEIHNRLAHLTSDKEAEEEDRKPAYNAQELEDCDLSMDILTFQRIDGNSHQVTHESNLGGHQWIFTQIVSTENLPVMCLRYDIDGIVWQPRNTASEGELQNFKINHVATYPALGYVLAAKQDRKFVVSSPDFSFAAVCDGSRHIYIYRQPESLNSALELRNRKTGRDVSKIAKQHVINLEDGDTILGLYASNDCIYVLCKKTLFGIKV